MSRGMIRLASNKIVAVPKLKSPTDFVQFFAKRVAHSIGNRAVLSMSTRKKFAASFSRKSDDVT